MAHRLNDNAEVGTYVYQPFHPAHAGVVIAVLEKLPNYGHLVRVLWLDGNTTQEMSTHLSNFGSLIDDHKHKLATHTETLDKLKGLIF
jgi:hypothetical protein